MSDDLLSGTSSSDTGRGGQLLPEGYYPQLRLVKAELFRQFHGTKPRTFTCDVEVIEGPAQGTVLKAPEMGEPAGTGTRSTVNILTGQVGSGPFEQLEHNQFPDQDVKGRARVMLFLGTLFGYTDTQQIDANINGTTLGMVTDEKTQPMTGTIFSARVTHVLTKAKPGKHNGKVIQKFTELAPVLENGKPKVIRGRGQQAPVTAPVTAPVAAPVQAPAPAAPPAPPPVAAPAAPVLPIGWKLHPQDPRWMYLESNPAEMKLVG